MQRKIIAKEIKQEILAKVKLGSKVVDLAKQYGVSDRSIYAWLQKDTTDEFISVLKYNKLKRENTELKRLIGELTLDLSLGKKN
jgi:transposase-like protein